MSDEIKHWKSKYLHSLQRLKEREELWVRRLDLLRRSLVRTSIAAEGVDLAVDSCMHELRDLLRRDALDVGMSNLVPRLEKALLDAERRRDERVEQIGSALRQLVEQLRQRELDGETDKALKKLAQRSDGRVGQLEDLEPLLRELVDLQSKALSQVDARPEARGLMQRLFGSGEVVEAAHAEVALAGGESGPLDVLPAPAAWCNSALAEALAESAARPLGPSSGPAYSQVAARIEKALTALLDDLRLPERYQGQVQSLRERVRGGLNWYELIPVLDDLAALLHGLSYLGQDEFQHYLQQLAERIDAVRQGLVAMEVDQGEHSSAVVSFDTALRQRVDELHAAVSGATDMLALQTAVEGGLGSLIEAVDAYRDQHEAREAQMNQRLRELSERLASVDQASDGVRDALAEQQRKASHDGLTGLPNRAAWAERLEQEVLRWQRYGGDLSLAMLDVDHFKRVNDSFGHAAGDRVLKIIAGKCQQRLRKTDFIARFGGEEFVLLMPETPLDAGQRIVDELRAAIEDAPFHFKGERVQVTVSGGVAAFAGEDGAEQVFERADEALYRAKNGGRNRVELG